MDAPFWLRLLTFGYARLRRATRIDLLGWADFEARVPLRPGLTCTLNPPTELALGPEPFRGLLSPRPGGVLAVPSCQANVYRGLLRFGGVPQPLGGTPSEASFDQCLCGLARRYAPRNSAIFRLLVCARPAGALRAVVEEAGEDGGKIREVVAFCTLGPQANVVRRDPQGAELAGQPVKCGGRSADCGGPRAIGQCAQRLQHLLRGHARAARLDKDLANVS